VRKSVSPVAAIVVIVIVVLVVVMLFVKAVRQKPTVVIPGAGPIGASGQVTRPARGEGGGGRQRGGRGGGGGQQAAPEGQRAGQ
jgi:hypothetical protein